MTTLPANLLKRKASRWQMRPTRDAIAGEGIETDKKSSSLLLFLRNLNTDGDPHAAFLRGLSNTDGTEDQDSIMQAMASAVQEIRHIGYDYLDVGNGKRRRLEIYGEEQARFELGEHDQLMDLARTVWTDPDNMTDFVAKAYQKTLRTNSTEQVPTIDDMFTWARSWAEVRYRFLNHALRDDPVLYGEIQKGRPRQKGDRANAMVHESNVLGDCRLVEFQPVGNIGYSDEDRALFKSLYVLTPEEGRQLNRFTSQLTGLRVGLPAVFRFCVTFIDAYMDWRIRVLAKARTRMRSSQAMQNTKAQGGIQNETAKQNATTATQLRSIDTIYSTIFIPRLKDLLKEADTCGAFYRDTFNGLNSAVKQFKAALANSPFKSTSPDLKDDVVYRKALDTLSNLNLVPPTGTAMINSRPKRVR
ncbi:hypothetical protein F4861DRAFT_60611 [Xylaria intraflava]|nr:hypothetical protein F4861DRAFT_60611 [Xylaria intraflava]